MDMLDNSLFLILEKVRTWIHWKGSLAGGNSCNYDQDRNVCFQCNLPINVFNQGSRCSICGHMFCLRCTPRDTLTSNCNIGDQLDGKQVSELCKICFSWAGKESPTNRLEENLLVDVGEKCVQRSLSSSSSKFGYTTMEQNLNIDPLSGGDDSPCSDAKGLDPCSQRRSDSLNTINAGSSLSPLKLLRPILLQCSTRTGFQETYDFTDADDAGQCYSTPTCENCRDFYDTDTSSNSVRIETYSFKSSTSSPFDSPTTPSRISERVDSSAPNSQTECATFENSKQLLQEKVETLLKSSEDTNNDLPMYQRQHQKMELVLDLEYNDINWLPPSENVKDEVERTNFESDDEDIGNSDLTLPSSSFGDDTIKNQGKLNDIYKEPVRDVIHGHFRVLVSQLLKGMEIDVGSDVIEDKWLQIVTSLAWQAANFVKPDTDDGGSMDPCNYVKVKCIACGHPTESTLIKGVVCTKKIKHKRMTSQYKNPSLLLLGGALEYQGLPDQLASIGTLLDEERNYIKMTVSKIEAHRPNVLLVEKSASPYAQEYLLAKDISLVVSVKRSVLERIARCTGAQIIPSIDYVASPRLGKCENFRLEKVVQECPATQNPSRKSIRTLMFFEGCPRRLGCTVLLKGAAREELKKVKHVLKYAVFAAYNLSLETSFLADEGASLPSLCVECPVIFPEKPSKLDKVMPLTPKSDIYPDKNLVLSEDQALGPINNLTPSPPKLEVHAQNKCRSSFDLGNEDVLSLHNRADPGRLFSASPASMVEMPKRNLTEEHATLSLQSKTGCTCEKTEPHKVQHCGELVSTVDTHQDIIVLFFSRCMIKETVCERSQFLQIKFYSCSDKPLGRFLRNDLFDQAARCRSCNEPAESHVQCYIHQQGTLTIWVKHTPWKLPGAHEGKIWMWRRCCSCDSKDGVSLAKRKIMSDAAWGLSFGKFLELSFSNNATVNRVAPCGHSLQRDCLRYYGCGNMIAVFRYAPSNIFTLFLPPPVLEYKSQVQQEWIKNEATDVSEKIKFLYANILDALQEMERKYTAAGPGYESLILDGFHNYATDFKELLRTEKREYVSLLRSAASANCQHGVPGADIFELAYLRRCLLIDSYLWDWRLCLLSSLVQTQKPSAKFDLGIGCKNPFFSGSFSEDDPAILSSWGCVVEGYPYAEKPRGMQDHLTDASGSTSSQCSSLPEKIDMKWTGNVEPLRASNVHLSPTDAMTVGSVLLEMQNDSNSHRTIMAPVRVYSFDSVQRYQERSQKCLFQTAQSLASIGSFHVSEDRGSLVGDSVPNMRRFYYRNFSCQKFDIILNHTPSFISSSFHMLSGGPKLLLPSTGRQNIVVSVYGDEPTSIIAYALSCKEYEAFVSDKLIDIEGPKSTKKFLTDVKDTVQPDSDDFKFRSYRSDIYVSSYKSLPFSDSAHFRTMFGGDSSLGSGKVRFTVKCYFAKQFDALRRKCSPTGIDFLRSLSRCRRWSAQGGKSNVYFAKTLDERFIVKQVTKTELESFEEFSQYYFKYLSDSLSSGSLTCLAKILGIYQVSIKNMDTGKEDKMDLMVTENLFFGRTISKMYDLKGSVRCRCNPDTSRVLLDENLLKVLRTNPIFLGSKAKLCLERAVWNDTFFLASVDVMDYSLLVGVDEDRKELVIGIIDFMRQYTWDKHLETWVKATGILGGPKNASPTVISPKQYKKRFRKAMSSYFLTVPDQWYS